MTRHTEKSIGFAPKLVPLVKDGSKTLTYRWGDKYDFLNVGDTILVRDSSTDKVFGEVKITEKSYTTFTDLPLDREGHEAYPSKERQREIFAQYYGRPISNADKILILGFELWHA